MDIFTLIKILALLLSFNGYILFLKKKFDLRVEFAPVLICAGIGIIMFISGIFKVMPIAVPIIWVIGILQLRLFRKDIFNKEEIIKLSIFGLISIFFLYFLRDTQFTHYDNFSHWALVAKDMILTDALPTKLSEIISFNSYPTGTAGFIYYVCKIIGNTEGCMAFAQMFMLLSGIFSITAFINVKNWYLSIIVVVLSIYFFVYNIYITELLVDTILAILGVSIMAIIFYYKDENPEKMIYFTMPILAFLPCVKNSGIYFCILSIVYMYLLTRKEEDKKYNKKIIKYSVVPTVLLMALWKIHVSLTFGSRGASKHSLSLKNYAATLLSKNKSDLVDITTAFAKQILSLKNDAVVLILIAILIAVFVCVIASIKKDTESIKFAKSMVKISIVVYITYTIGVFLMYIFSMPTKEALVLAGYDRYNKTIILYIYGMITTLFLKNSIKWEGIEYCNTFLIAISLTVFMIFSQKHGVGYNRLLKPNDYSETIRTELKDLKEKYNIKDNERYLIYLSNSEESTDYTFYVSKYEFRSINIKVYNYDSIDDEKINLDEFDYLISLNDDERIESLLQENGINKYKDVIELN